MGDAEKTLACAEHLLQAGIFAPAIRPPTVHAGECRIRFSVTSEHSEDDIDQLVGVLKEVPSPLAGEGVRGQVANFVIMCVNFDPNQTDAERKLWMLRPISSVRITLSSVGSTHRSLTSQISAVLRNIEVDGSQHALQESYDKERTKYLEENGFRVLRFWNNQVLKEGRSVTDTIFEALVTPHPPFGRLLPQGEKERQA